MSDAGHTLSTETAKERLVTEALFVEGFEAETKKDALRSMVRRVLQLSTLSRDEVETVGLRLLKREREASSALENGCAIPHLALEDKLNRAYLGWFYSEAGVNFDSRDGSMTHCLACVIGPSREYLPLLAHVLAMFRQKNFLSRLQADPLGFKGFVRRMAVFRLESPSMLDMDRGVSARVTVFNPLGLHARAATELARLAHSFESEIRIGSVASGQWANCKSIMEILTLAVGGQQSVPNASDVDLQVEGEDQELALEHLITFLRTSTY